MKLVKLLRYPVLFIAVILLPPFLANIFLQFPEFFEQQGWLEANATWQLISALTGYLAGYYLIYETITRLNELVDEPMYSMRIKKTYLITNAITSVILLGVLTGSISSLYAEQPLNFDQSIIFIGLPWVSIQMLLLLFFVRSEDLYN